MDYATGGKIRGASQQRRRPPGDPARLVATFQDGGRLNTGILTEPTELTLEATNAESEVAAWCDDGWWTRLIRCLADCPLSVHVAPTPGALLHPVILHQLEMIRRVTPNWRIVGHGYLAEAAADDDLCTVAASPYHEVRFIDQPRPGSVHSDRYGCQRPLEEVFRLIRQEQVRLGITTPVLVRMPSNTPAASFTMIPVACPTTEQARLGPVEE